MTDYDMVLECWEDVESDYAGYGGKVLTRLFKEHPHTRKLFPKIKGIPTSDLVGNVLVAAHGATVLKKLGKLLKAKKDHTLLHQLLITSHANTQKIALNDFRLITDVLVEVMADEQRLYPAKQGLLKNVMDDLISYIENCNYKEIGFDC